MNAKQHVTVNIHKKFKNIQIKLARERAGVQIIIRNSKNGHGPRNTNSHTSSSRTANSNNYIAFIEKPLNRHTEENEKKKKKKQTHQEIHCISNHLNSHFNQPCVCVCV